MYIYVYIVLIYIYIYTCCGPHILTSSDATERFEYTPLWLSRGGKRRVWFCCEIQSWTWLSGGRTKTLSSTRTKRWGISSIREPRSPWRAWRASSGVTARAWLGSRHPLDITLKKSRHHWWLCSLWSRCFFHLWPAHMDPSGAYGPVYHFYIVLYDLYVVFIWF